MVIIIAAIAENNCIGKEGKIPWHIPEDLKRFKELTLGKNVLMGRKTFESILGYLGKPLPNRKNIVITRQPDFKPESVIVVSSLDSALASSGYTLNPVFIIGGGEIYAQALPLADRLYITEVHHDFPEGDVFFPAIDKNIWRETSRVKGVKDEKNIYDYDFVIYEKK